MKKTIALMLALIITTLSLTGCGESSDAPAGMQLVRGSDTLGYYLYAPTGWLNSSQGNIAATYVSTIDTTSVTLVEADMPKGSIEEYFEAAKGDFTFPITITKANADFKLGNAEESKQFIFEYEYSGYKFRTMQVFARFGDSFYIFSFTSQLGERRDGESYYDYHLKTDLPSITSNIKFVKKSGEVEKPQYTEKDGYVLVSDRKLSGFNLYVTKDYSVDFSDGIVSVSREDGSNITLTKATETGLGIESYWKSRKKELEAIVGKVTVIGDDGDEIGLGRHVENALGLGGDLLHGMGDARRVRQTQIVLRLERFGEFHGDLAALMELEHFFSVELSHRFLLLFRR